MVHFTHIYSDIFYKIGLLKDLGKRTGKHLCKSFLLQKVAHFQACNFVKKRLQHKYFSLNFAKLLKALCRTAPASGSDFNSTFLNLRPPITHVCVFPELLFLDISKPLHVPY